MKKVFVVIVVLLISSCVFAQAEEGDIELSASSSFGSYSLSANQNHKTYSGDAMMYLTTAFRIGYYFTQAVELEPELYVYFGEKNQPAYNLNANFDFNYIIPGSGFRPFALLGYGLRNSFPLLPAENSFIRVKNKLDIGCLNLGAGSKIFVNKNIAVRIEYRYQRYSNKDKEDFSGNNYELILNLHRVLFGMSFII